MGTKTIATLMIASVLIALNMTPAQQPPMTATEAPNRNDIAWRCVGPGGGG
jgi:hypothetical protein